MSSKVLAEEAAQPGSHGTAWGLGRIWSGPQAACILQSTMCAPHRAFPVFPYQVEALLASEDYGKDLASVNNLLKKHQLLEADISAHEVGRA